MKPTDTKGALNYRITRAFLYFLYCYFHYLLFCVLEHNVWNILKHAISARGIQDETLADIHIHTKTHIALAHMHHKNTDSRSRSVRQQLICCLLCITWTRPAVNPWNIEAPFIFRALYRWQSRPNGTVFTKSLHLNVTIFILHIKRHEMCPKKLKVRSFVFSLLYRMLSFIHHTKTILTRCTWRYSCPLFQQGHASWLKGLLSI